MHKSIKTLFKNNLLVTQIRNYQKRPSLLHLNELQPIKVSSNFIKNYDDRVYTPAEDESHELKMAMKMLHLSPKYKKKWYE